MPLFKEFRRKKTSSKTDKPQNSFNDSNGSNGTNGTVPTTTSSSTINSVYASSTAPSSIQPNQSTPTLVTSKSTSTMTPLPQRPMPVSSVSNRGSFMVCMRAPARQQMSHSCISQYEGEPNRGADLFFPQGLNTPSINGNTTLKMPSSSFAPRIMSVSDNSWVGASWPSQIKHTLSFSLKLWDRYIKKYFLCMVR